MRVRFKGEGPDEEGVVHPCTVFGVTFEAGKVVDVSKLAPEFQAKLARIPLFEEVKAAPVVAPPAAAPKP